MVGADLLCGRHQFTPAVHHDARATEAGSSKTQPEYRTSLMSIRAVRRAADSIGLDFQARLWTAVAQ
jgi:hypothetical protein